jgi:hypothetical protein
MLLISIASNIVGDVHGGLGVPLKNKAPNRGAHAFTGPAVLVKIRC